MLERVRLWRRSGVDARVLLLDIRRSGERLAVRVIGEDAPQRDRLERLLLDRFADTAPPPGQRPVLRLHFYDQPSASTGRRHGGALLGEPWAEIIHADGQVERVEG